jgi:hypothetical protein
MYKGFDNVWAKPQVREYPSKGKGIRKVVPALEGVELFRSISIRSQML